MSAAYIAAGGIASPMPLTLTAVLYQVSLIMTDIDHHRRKPPVLRTLSDAGWRPGFPARSQF